MNAPVTEEPPLRYTAFCSTCGIEVRFWVPTRLYPGDSVRCDQEHPPA